VLTGNNNANTSISYTLSLYTVPAGSYLDLMCWGIGTTVTGGGSGTTNLVLRIQSSASTVNFSSSNTVGGANAYLQLLDRIIVPEGSTIQAVYQNGLNTVNASAFVTGTLFSN